MRRLKALLTITIVIAAALFAHDTPAAHAERVPVKVCVTHWTGIYDGSAGIHARAHTICHTHWVNKHTPKPAPKPAPVRMLDPNLWPSVRQWSGYIFSASDQTGVSANLIGAVMETESAGQASAFSSTGAEGLMQVEPQTGAAYAYGTSGNLWDPRTNVLIGARVLAAYIRSAGSVFGGLESYNCGSPSPVCYGYAVTVLGRL